MAIDKAVDSAKLNACLDAEADAIRAKTGGSADIPFDYANNKGFADAIAAIPSGGGGWELIAEATTTEDVEAFRVDIPAAKQNMEAYLVWYDCTLLKGTASSSGIYHCPQINSVFVGGAYPSPTPTGAYFIGIAKGSAGYKMVVSGTAVPNRGAEASVEYVAMVGFYAGNLVSSGSTIKVYGIGEPT